MSGVARRRVVLHLGATREPRHVQSTTLNRAQALRDVRRYLGMSRLTIWSATLRRSGPTMSGVSASGNSAFPERLTKAAAQPARIAPSTSHACAATSRSWGGATWSSVALKGDPSDR